MMRLLRLALILTLALALPAGAAHAAPYKDHQARNPDLFDPATGLRVARQRAPTPDDIPPPAVQVTPEQARRLLDQGVLAIDVFGAAQSRFDELDGTWLVSQPRLSLPGAVWLPETGRGQLSAQMQRYLEQNLTALTRDNRAHPIMVFCVADCWMSWNSAQRIADLGYSRVYWFRLGTDGWLDIGGTLHQAEPVPVRID